MKKFVLSVVILAFVIVLLTPAVPIYAAQTLYCKANESNGITASGSSVTAQSGQSGFYADTANGNKTIYFNVKIDDKIEQIYYSSFDYSIISLKEMIEQFKTTLNYAVFFDFLFIIASLSFSVLFYKLK